MDYYWSVIGGGKRSDNSHLNNGTSTWWANGHIRNTNSSVYSKTLSSLNVFWVFCSSWYSSFQLSLPTCIVATFWLSSDTLFVGSSMWLSTLLSSWKQIVLPSSWRWMDQSRCMRSNKFQNKTRANNRSLSSHHQPQYINSYLRPLNESIFIAPPLCFTQMIFIFWLCYIEYFLVYWE